MGNILLGYLQNFDKHGEVIPSYAHSTHRALLDLGHTVTAMGEGHGLLGFRSIATSALNNYDLFLDIDNGRNSKGDLAFQDEKPPIPSAVRFIDTHGNPSLHKRRAKHYDHVFFAVFDKRDLFTHHTSVHWCPNASDAKYFYKDILPDAHESRPFDVGFFGSKGGLERADILDTVAQRNKWKVDIREVGKNGNRWPKTAEAMAQCKVLFNAGQKHDGPNQRVIESMLMGRPLINDRDARDGMTQLFEEGEHFLSYTNKAELANQIQWCFREPSMAASMAKRAYQVAYEKHQVKHRVEQILEVVGL